MSNNFYYIKTNITECGDIGSMSIRVYDDNKLLDGAHFAYRPTKIKLSSGLGSKVKFADFLFPINLYTSYCLLFSDKVMNIVDDYNLPNCSTLEVEVRKGRHSKTYNYLQVKESIFPYLVIDQVQLARYNRINKEWSNAHVTKDYLYSILVKGDFPGYPKKKGDLYTRLRKLQLKKGFDLDIFSAGKFGKSIIISERLKGDFQASGITGLEYEEIDFISIQK